MWFEKNHQFTYGRHVQIITDHKPLVAIVSKPLSKAPKRLQSMILRTQRYSYSLEYRPEKTMLISDALSRSPLDGKADQRTLRVSNVDLCPINDSRSAQIRDATNKDTTLTALRTVITTGWPENKATLPPPIAVYFNF